MALFSDTVSDEEKTSIVAVLKKPETKKDRRRVDAKTIVLFQTMSLSDFVTRRSLNLFHCDEAYHYGLILKSLLTQKRRLKQFVS